MTQLSILVVDDSLIMQKKISTMVDGFGHHVIATAATGQEAIEKCAEYTPDLVTMDITMPDMNGIEATRKILAAHPDCTIIMVTSHGQESMVMEAIDAGAKGYVLKPVDKDKLANTINGVVNRTR
ncbi:MAG: response regulator [Rhodospirillaceae bacterium]